LEFSDVPVVGEGEGLELDEDESEDGEEEGVEFGGTTLFWIEEPEAGVVVGVGWVTGVD